MPQKGHLLQFAFFFTRWPGGGGLHVGRLALVILLFFALLGGIFFLVRNCFFQRATQKSDNGTVIFAKFPKIVFFPIGQCTSGEPVEAHAHFFSALPSFPHLLSCLWLIVSYVAPGKPGLGFTDRTSTITLCDLSGPDKGFVGGSGGPSKAASSNLFKSISCLSRVIGLLSTAKDGASSSFLPYRCALQKRANMWHSLLWKHPRLFRFPIYDFATLCSETFPVVQ